MVLTTVTAAGESSTTSSAVSAATAPGRTTEAH